MLKKVAVVVPSGVALRKESVDRNFCHEIQAYTCTGSLSARRAWIEITIILYAFVGVLVALRKESVDRNLDIDYYITRK